MSKRVFVAGHKGMVGSAICRQLQTDNDIEIITCGRASLDLRQQDAVARFFKNSAIDQIYLAAAKVGGIIANSQFPADFIYDNLIVQTNVIHAAHLHDVNDLLFLGSSCIYPKFANQPIQESELLKGKLEPTNEPYAIAKIAGIKMCEAYKRQYQRNYRSVMPTNLYGVGDNFHPEHSHVIPGLIRRIHEAKLNKQSSVSVWGSGKAQREFLYVDDMASASVHVMNIDDAQWQQITQSSGAHINVGSGQDCSIAFLAKKIADVVGFQGRIEFDTSKPDGTPRKLLNIEKISRLGWSPKHSLDEGLKKTYQWFCANEC